MPVGDPVEGAGEGEGGHLGVAGPDRPVRHALTDELAQSLVDLRLQRLDLGAHGFVQVFLFQANHAPTEIARDGDSVVPCDGHQSFAGVAASRLSFAETGEDLIDAVLKALEEQLFFAVDVTVDRGLRDVQGSSQIVEAGVVVTAGRKSPSGSEDDRVALPISLP